MEFIEKASHEVVYITVRYLSPEPVDEGLYTASERGIDINRVKIAAGVNEDIRGVNPESHVSASR